MIPIDLQSPALPVLLQPPLLQVSLPSSPSYRSTAGTAAPPSYWEAVQMDTEQALPRYEELYGDSV